MGDIWSAIAQYGVGPVVVGVLLYLLIYFQQKRAEARRTEAENTNKRLEKEQRDAYETKRREQELEFEAKILGMMTEIIEGPKHTPEEQTNNRRMNQFILSQLDCLVEKGADRSYIFSFHNGGRDVLGKGYLKMSIMQESIGQDIKPIMGKYQNAPRMMFPKLYDALDTNNYYDIENAEDIKDKDPFTYQFMIEHGVKSALFRSIKSEDGLMIGFIGAEYISEKCDDMKKAGKLIDRKVNRIIGAMLGHDDN